MNTESREPEKKPSFVLKEFLAQKDKSANDAVVSLRPNMYALAKGDDKEAQLKKDTVGTFPPFLKCTAYLTAPLGSILLLLFQCIFQEWTNL